MGYQFQFGAVLSRLDLLRDGLLMTVYLTVLSALLGFAIGLVCSLTSRFGRPWMRWPVTVYVELFRNTPFLVQLFIVYFGLPQLGTAIGVDMRLSPFVAALIALSISLGAYLTEILRAGLSSINRGQIEAADSLGLTRFQTIRDVVFVPALAAVYPALSSQFVLNLLGTSIVSAISVEELTGAAGRIQAVTFRTFETYFVIWAIYFALAAALKIILDLIAYRIFGWRRAAGRR